MALGERQHLGGPRGSLTKPLAFSPLSLFLFFCTQKVNLVSSEIGRLAQALEPPTAFPPPALNSLMGQS